MNIIDDRVNKKVKFSELPVGSTFYGVYNQDDHNGKVNMRIADIKYESIDVVKYNAVCLNDGAAIFVHETDYVTPCELIVRLFR